MTLAWTFLHFCFSPVSFLIDTGRIISENAFRILVSKLSLHHFRGGHEFGVPQNALATPPRDFGLREADKHSVWVIWLSDFRVSGCESTREIIPI
jgi:hypothetical protein